jgi:hypothetical protein
MSTQQSLYSKPATRSDPTFPPSNQFEDDTYKASYDDLIDEYATPYSLNAQHKVFSVDTPIASNERRRPAYPPGTKPSLSKPSISSEFSPKESEEGTVVAYPQAYPPTSNVKEVDPRGFWDKILPESVASRLYVITVLVETAIDLAIEGEIRVRFHTAETDPTSTRKMPVYLSIFALAHVFQFVMAIDAVYARNTLQFLALTIFNALFLVYAIIQIGEIRRTLQITPEASDGVSRIPIDVLTTIIPIVISVAELAYIALGWKIYHEFGWKVYKFLGADRRIKTMYAQYQIFQCLIKFDLFFWVGFSVQFIWLVLQHNDWEYYLTCAALPLSILLLVEGHLAARHENKWMMFTFMSGCAGALVYFIYKLVKVIIYKDTDQFSSIYKTLTTFSVIAIALLLVTFVFAITVVANFGRGLKDTLGKTKPRPGAPHPHNRAASTHINRMSID